MHYVPEPLDAIAEAYRALKPGGRLLIVDMMPHDREDLLHEMGHVWRGFSEETIRSMLLDAGFSSVRYQPLPADEAAKGPSLFSAVGRKAKARRAETAVDDGTDEKTMAQMTTGAKSLPI